MINARARLHQLPHGSCLLVLRQALLVVDAQLGQGLVELDLAAIGMDAEQHAQQALARRVQVHRLGGLAELVHHHAVVDDEVGIGAQLAREVVGRLQLVG